MLVFTIDIEACEKCQGPLRKIACIEDPEVIRQILEHLRNRENTVSQARLASERASPQSGCQDQNYFLTTGFGRSEGPPL